MTESPQWMKAAPDTPPAPGIDTTVPHAARLWNYRMGGKDNFAADRAAGDAVAGVYPGIVTMAKVSRPFLIRAVSFLAGEAGIRQFLDIGAGLPTMQNTHEVAQRVAPDSRVVYIDNDPLVLVHARALLANTTSEGTTNFVLADYNDPGSIISHAREVLDFSKPMAVMFMGVLGYVQELADVRSIVDRIIEPVPSGSYLVLWDGTATSQEVIEGSERLAQAGAVPYYLRMPDELQQCFEGMEMVDPGLVQITEWRPEADEVERIDAYGAVARKP